LTSTSENLEATKALLIKNKNEIACFIYEPILQGAGGMNMYDAPQMNELLKR